MIPIFDDIRTRRTPVLTIGLILSCVLVFLYQQTLPDDDSLGGQIAFACEFGMVPAHTIGGADPALDIEGADGPVTCEGVNQQHNRFLGLFTSQFLHGDWWHLLGNMLFLWVFGNNVEDRLGRLRFLPFYLLCGALAALAQGLTETSSGVPLIGASGAIAGIIGAYLLLHPRAGIWTLVAMVIPAKIPAWMWGGIYFALQFLALGDSATADEGGVAYWAHIGGFLAGMALIRPFAVGRDDGGPPPLDRSSPGLSSWR